MPAASRTSIAGWPPLAVARAAAGTASASWTSAIVMAAMTGDWSTVPVTAGSAGLMAIGGADGYPDCGRRRGGIGRPVAAGFRGVRADRDHLPWCGVPLGQGDGDGVAGVKLGPLRRADGGGDQSGGRCGGQYRAAGWDGDFPLASGCSPVNTFGARLLGPIPGSAGPPISVQGCGNTFLKENRFDIVEKLDAFAKERGYTLLELAFSWQVSQPFVGSVIAGATRPEQVEANAAAARWTLTDDDFAAVAAIVA